MQNLEKIIVGGFIVLGIFFCLVAIAMQTPAGLLGTSPIALTLLGAIIGSVPSWLVSRHYAQISSKELKDENSGLIQMIDSMRKEHKEMTSLVQQVAKSMLKAGDKTGIELQTRANVSVQNVQSILFRKCPAPGCEEEVSSLTGSANDFSQGIRKYFYTCPKHGRFIGGWDELDVD